MKTPIQSGGALVSSASSFSNLVLDVAYVGSRNLDLINSLNMNQASPGPGALQPRGGCTRPTRPCRMSTIGRIGGIQVSFAARVNLRKRYWKELTLRGHAETTSHLR